MLKRLDGEDLVAAEEIGDQSVDHNAADAVQTSDASADASSAAASFVETSENQVTEDHFIDDEDQAELIVGEKITDQPDDNVVVDTDLLYDDQEPETELEEEPQSLVSALTSGDSQAFLLSLVVHTILILSLALIPILADKHEPAIVLTELPAAESPDELTISEDLAFSDEPAENMGANSIGDSGMALSTAAIVADVPNVESIAPQIPIITPSFDLGNRIQQAVGLVKSDTAVKGMTGVGTTGTDGAVDRITYEILQKLEERPTLVVWFFDQSASLQRRRQEIRDRFDRIYKELGLIQEARQEKETKPADEPLLTSIFAFGDKVSQLTEKPTADMEEIRGVIDSITMDQTGNEKVFSAFYLAVEKYKNYRSSRASHGVERNVVFIAVTDERGDDAPQGLEATIRECRKYSIPVYVIGVPAPFGREFTYVKYVDPDPKYDQTPQWGQVDQGPESLMPERVKLGYRDNVYDEPMMDSGFGPYALSRLAYETGGIYFTVHPNRRFNSRVNKGEIDAFASELNYFFDPEIMAKYRPDYVSQEEYLKKAKESPLRQVLIGASRLAAVETLQAPRTRFVKRDEPSFVNELTQAQQAAAKLEPQLAMLAQALAPGQAVRDRETSPRWLAGYDLAVGTVLAHKIRAEAYNAMLAKAKRGIPFQNAKSNTWVLKPMDEISVGSKMEKEAEFARDILKRVAQEHAGTPWALLAKRELDNPVGWKWVEDTTDLNPPRPQARPNNNPPPPPAAAKDDKARMLNQAGPKRPIPKL